MAEKLFGTSGIRGKVVSEVTCELALKVGKSLAYYFEFCETTTSKSSPIFSLIMI